MARTDLLCLLAGAALGSLISAFLLGFFSKEIHRFHDWMAAKLDCDYDPKTNTYVRKAGK